MKGAVAGALCGFAVLTSCVWMTMAADSVPGDDDGWKAYSSKAGQFTVSIPRDCTAKEEKGSTTIIQGDDTERLRVMYFEIADKVAKANTPDRLLDNMQDLLEKAATAKLKVKGRKAKNIRSGNHPGRDVELEVEQEVTGAFGDTDTFKLTYHMRYYIIGRRAYMLAAMHPATDDARKDAERILTSFRPAGTEGQGGR